MHIDVRQAVSKIRSHILENVDTGTDTHCQHGWSGFSVLSVKTNHSAWWVYHVVLRYLIATLVNSYLQRCIRNKRFSFQMRKQEEYRWKMFLMSKHCVTFGEFAPSVSKSAQINLASPSPLTSSISRVFGKVYNRAAGSQSASSHRLVPKPPILWSDLKVTRHNYPMSRGLYILSNLRIDYTCVKVRNRKYLFLTVNRACLTFFFAVHDGQLFRL